MQAVHDAAASPQPTRGRVLFVCDRPNVDPAVASVAADLGYEVLRVRSADEALQHTAPPGFALILAGYADNVHAFAAVLRRLRAAFPPTPLVAIGLPPQRDFPVEPLYEAGALSVLDEPISPPILKSKARFYLDAYDTAAERTRTQAVLEETRARLEATIAAAEVGVWTWEIGADRLVADRRTALVYGVDPDLADRAPLSAYFAAVHPDDDAALRLRLQKAVETGASYAATYRVRDGSGGWRWVLARAQVERTGREATRLRGVVIDVTVQKQAEERLQASEERYRTLFDSVDDGVCVVEMLYDAGGKPVDYRFLEVNPAFAAATGLHDALGKTIRSLAPAHEQRWFDVYGRVAATGEPVRFVEEAAALGRWYDVYAARVGPAGSHKVVVLFNDITERRRTELELRRLANDLAEQDRRKTAFLATLAHELRNPLAPIRSGLQLMRRSKGDPQALARVQDIMDRQIDHLVHLVDDLLDVARITRGQIELKPAWIDLEDVVRAAVDTSMPLIETARHRLDLRLPATPLQLYADPVRLTQVVSNLLNNAAKYTPRGGAIVVAVERETSNEAEQGQAVIVVSDNGIGIPAESLEAIFQMFTQVSHPDQRSQGGLGIGLSLVRSLVELHGGTITAASRGIDAGSVFTVRLPLAGPDRPAPAGRAPGTAGTAPSALKLLVVDDNRDAAETLAALLGILGHTAPVAADGYQALRMIASLRPQIVFLDIGMPGLSGHEVAEKVRADPQFDGVRLVALTGWGGEADRARSSAAGFDAHLTKPATVAAIEEVLARLASPVQR